MATRPTEPRGATSLIGGGRDVPRPGQAHYRGSAASAAAAVPRLRPGMPSPLESTPAADRRGGTGT